MKGYYVIPKEDDPIEITGKNARARAIKIARDLFLNGDDTVMVLQFNDNDADGFAANGEKISPEDLFKEI